MATNTTEVAGMRRYLVVNGDRVASISLPASLEMEQWLESKQRARGGTLEEGPSDWQPGESMGGGCY